MRVKPDVPLERIVVVLKTWTRKTSKRFVDSCKDQLKVFPSRPCRCISCDWHVKQRDYMNCSFVVSQVGDHSLEEVAGMMKITREGVRQIQNRALEKILASGLSLENLEPGNELCESCLAAGADLYATDDEGTDASD